MSRGGYRSAAGRPKGPDRPNAPSQHKEYPGVTTPLEYMLAVMNDSASDDGRRDRMAIAAAPYVHARAADAKLGKKEEAEQAALTAERGTSWETLLQ